MNIIEKKTKKNKVILKTLVLTLLFLLTLPIMSLAASSSSVTYDTKGATTVPSQTAFNSFNYPYKYYWNYNGSLYLYGSNNEMTFANNKLTSTTSIVQLSPDDSTFAHTTGSAEFPNGSTVLLYSSTPVVPDPEPEPEPEPEQPPLEGGDNVFSGLTTSAITTNATTWANHFDELLLVVVGVGIGFACVRFVKSLFF